MKKIIQCLAVVFLVILMFINISAFAQDEEGHIFTVSTFKAVMPEGGSAAERDSLLMIGVELQKLNPKQLSVKLLRHTQNPKCSKIEDV